MFDTALLESRKDRKGRGKGAGLPLALGLHVAVIGAFVGASVWSVGEVPEPVTPVIFCNVGSGLRPPVGTGGRKNATALPRHDRVATTQPLALATEQSPLASSVDPEGPEYPAPDDDSEPGDLTGVRGGMGDSPVVEPGPAQDAHPLIVGGDVKAPVLIFRTEPGYPESMRQAHVEGLVILEAVITAGGAVEELRVLRSANPLLDRAVLDAVRQWRYKPATLNGRAVSVYLTVTVTFGLRS